MGCYLLTGATGLVGSHVLKDLLAQGHQVAVLVRPEARITARDRIEEILAVWEEREQRFWPRPVVLEGELLSPALGLGAAELRWLTAAGPAVVHLAASLRFVREAAGDEPYATNVGGTQRLLDVCGRAGLTEFHLVSTAYCGGESHGKRVEEVEHAGDREFHNDYEQSKLAAERLVQAAPGLSSTIYRPSIVVGDSNTGHATAFVGFYSVVQAALDFYRWAPRGANTHWDLVDALGLQGHEGKNLVCVDWVSQALVRLVLKPSAHRRIYHLTNPRPVTAREMEAAIGTVLKQLAAAASPAAVPSAPPRADLDPAIFREHLAVYRPYFAADPAFDSIHTRTELPELACPELTHDRLVKLAHFAIQCDFGRKLPGGAGTSGRSAAMPGLHRMRPPGLTGGTHPLAATWTERRLDLAAASSDASAWRLRLSGACGGEWVVQRRGAEGWSLRVAVPRDADLPTVHTSLAVIERVVKDANVAPRCHDELNNGTIVLLVPGALRSHVEFELEEWLRSLCDPQSMARGPSGSPLTSSASITAPARGGRS